MGMFTGDEDIRREREEREQAAWDDKYNGGHRGGAGQRQELDAARERIRQLQDEVARLKRGQGK